MSAVRVLLLEDSPSYSELVQAQLEDTLPEAGVHPSTTLAHALELLRSGRYDVVLADLTLPDADGLDVVRQLHARGRGTALVVLTGHADGQLALEALAAGAQEYLVKGADDGSRLATVIRHALQRTRTEQEARRYERLARSLLDALEAPTCAVDSDSRLIAVNAAWDDVAEASGIEPGEVGVGRSYLAACDAVPPDSPDAGASRRGRHRAARRAGRPARALRRRLPVPQPAHASGGSASASAPPRSTAAAEPSSPTSTSAT